MRPATKDSCLFRQVTFVLIAVIVLTLPDAAQAGWIDLGGDGVTTRVLESDGQRTVYEIIVGGFESTEIDIDGERHRHITLPREGLTLVEGLPDLPSASRADHPG